MAGKAELVKLCSISQVLAACACNGDGTTTQVKEVVVIDAKQRVIPHNSEDYPSVNNSPDGSGFIRSYFTDLEGNVIGTPTDWKYGSCGECEEPPNNLTTVCLENNATGEVIPGLVDFNCNDGDPDSEQLVTSPIDFSDFNNSSQDFTVEGAVVTVDYSVSGGGAGMYGHGDGVFSFQQNSSLGGGFTTVDFNDGNPVLDITLSSPQVICIDEGVVTTDGAFNGVNENDVDALPDRIADHWLLSSPGGFIVDDPLGNIEVTVIDPDTIQVKMLVTDGTFQIYTQPTTNINIVADSQPRSRLRFTLVESGFGSNICLYNSNGDPLDPAEYTIVANCDQFNTELIGPLCVRDANGGIVATVNQINVFDNADPPVLQSSTLFDATTGAAYVLGADETLGNCSTDPVLVKDGCLCDVVAGTYTEVYQILIPDGNGSYEFANASYVLQADGSAVTPSADAVFKVGQCPSGGMCETC